MSTGGIFKPTLSGSVQVFCVHKRLKREITIIEFDAAEHNPNVCDCCQNMFLTKTTEPLSAFCQECDPKNRERSN